MMRRLAWAGLIPLAVLASASAASAGVVVYSPTPGDLYDLDHHYAYTWRIGNINVPAGESVKGASLVFTNMYNWDTNPNQLFIHLLDTARYSGVASYQDAPLNQTPVTTISDEFTESHVGDSNWLVTAGTPDTFLTQRSFAALGVNPNSAPGPGPSNPAGWSYVTSGTRSGKPLYTYTYTFTKSQAATLGTYINSSAAKTIALGFDADCHFYNDGIKLNIDFGPANVVPEPASLLLFGVGGLFAVHRLRKARAARG